MKIGGRKFLIIFCILAFLLPNFVFSAATVQWQQTNYWFRDDDGGESSATGYGASNAAKNTDVTNVSAGANFRLRFAVKAIVAAGAISPRIEFRQGSDCSSGTWTAISTSTAPFSLRLSNFFADGDATTQQISSGNFTAGKMLETTNPSPSRTVNQNYSTEDEWSLAAGNGVTFGATYAFRITNNGVALNSYPKCPLLTIASLPAPPEIASRVTLIRFFGRAYPGAQITLLRKIGEEETPLQSTTVASDAGDFGIVFEGDLFGLYAYGIKIADKDGRLAPVKFYDLDINLFSVTDQDIFAPPTIGLVGQVVSKDGEAALLGYATPNNSVEVELDGKIMDKFAIAGSDGFYKIVLSAKDLSPGVHLVRARQFDGRLNRRSDWSIFSNFSVSSLANIKTDLNNDGIINISDWSIFLSLWNRRATAEAKVLDFNGDGKIDIADFSLFLLAFKKL